MSRPKLRTVERFEQVRDDQRLLVLRDPLGVSEPFALDAEFTPVLDMLDGSRTVAQIRQSLLMRGVLNLPADELAAFVRDLSAAGWLDDELFSTRWARAHRTFLETDPRTPALAGALYPAEPEALRATLSCALPACPDRTVDDSAVTGIVAPHGPLELVSSVLDLTLRQLPDPDLVDLVVVLGTDHGPGLLPYALTRRRYATPLGAVPTASRICAALERRLPWVTREEIRHREALSIELAALYLQALYGERCPPMLPVLCGQTVLSSAERVSEVEAFIGTLETLVEDHRVLWWASAELSHGGPAYGRPEMTSRMTADVAARDEACLQALRHGRAERLAVHCTEAHPQGRPSGGAALTTMVRLLPVGYRTELVAYETKTVPGPVPGVVSMAGIRFYGS